MAPSEQHSDVVFGKVNTEEQRELANYFRSARYRTDGFREQIIVYSQPGVTGVFQCRRWCGTDMNSPQGNWKRDRADRPYGRDRPARQITRCPDWPAHGPAVTCSMTATAADTDTHYNRIQLQAQQLESVGNDTLHVTLNTYGEARDPASLATRINEDMEWALRIARHYEEVTAGTGA
jgi:hypothetical protein